MKSTKRIAFCLAAILIFTMFAGSALANTHLASYSEIFDEKNITAYSLTYNNDGVDTVKDANVDETDVFEASSNGKVVAAIIALRLADSGQISLDDKITEYISADLVSDSSGFEKITVAELIHHTSGLATAFQNKLDKTVYFEPGSQFRYSGVGYVYLQNIIENVTGKTLQDAASEYVFVPAGMANSTFEQSKTVTPYISSATLAIYAIVGFIIAFTLIFLIGLVIYFLTKKKFTIRQLFVVSLIVGAIMNIVILASVLSKVLIYFLGFAAISTIMLIVLFNKGRLLYLSMSILTILTLTIGLIINTPLPTTSDLIAPKANAAYTFKTTSADFNALAEHILSLNILPSQTMVTLFQPQIEVSDNLSWSNGLAIESNSSASIFHWHTGINPGFQSIIVIDIEKNSYITVLTNSDKGLDAAKTAVNDILGFNGKLEIPMY